MCGKYVSLMSWYRWQVVRKCSSVSTSCWVQWVQSLSSDFLSSVSLSLSLSLSVSQVITFESWSTSSSPVQEVQKVNVSSSCVDLLCGSTFFSLAYGDAQTGRHDPVTPVPFCSHTSILSSHFCHCFPIYIFKCWCIKEINSCPVIIA